MSGEQSYLDECFLQSATATFRKQKALAERAIEQLSDGQLHERLDENTNSVAVIIKHMAGNMRSRWTDFLTTDGEKPWRKRDTEFVDDIHSQATLMALWEEGWECTVSAVGALKAEDLTKTITIRGHEHTVIEAIHRQIDHYGYHVGQIILIARILAKESWQTLTVPPGESEEYNRQVWRR